MDPTPDGIEVEMVAHAVHAHNIWQCCLEMDLLLLLLLVVVVVVVLFLLLLLLLSLLLVCFIITIVIIVIIIIILITLTNVELNTHTSVSHVCKTLANVRMQFSPGGLGSVANEYSTLDWVNLNNVGKTIINHPQNHHRWYKPFPNGWCMTLFYQH